MADEILEEGSTEGVTKTTPSEGTTDNGYLTKPYLVRNLQTFWGKIKQYITDKMSGFADKLYVSGFVDNAVKGKANASDLEALETTLEALEATISDKVSQSELTEALAGKVDIEQGKGLSTKDFTAEYETKLKGLKNYDVVSSSEDGLMSVAYKEKLDSITKGATAVTVDSVWDPTSENPAQSKVISAELAKKADKEDNPSDPSDLIRLNNITSYATDEGHIVLNFIRDTEHLKIYTPNSDRPIEKVSLRDSNETLFTNFKKTDNDTLAITIENPEGKKDENSWNINAYTSFNFYIENLTVENQKYKPFILKAKRIDEEDLTKIQLEIIKVFES